MTSRPAETAGVGAAVALLVGHLLGITDAATLTALGVVVGAVPAAVTWVVVRARRRKTPTAPTA